MLFALNERNEASREELSARVVGGRVGPRAKGDNPENGKGGVRFAPFYVTPAREKSSNTLVQGTQSPVPKSHEDSP